MTFLALSRMARAFRAANAPIDTWSSWFAEVGMESTDDGWARTLFSDTRAAEVYCAIMKPLFSPLSSTRKGGSPEREASTSLACLLSDMFASSATAMPKKSIARASGCPWKLPPLMATSASANIRGLSVTEFISTSRVLRT